jgi:hypothetical protein
MIWACEDCQPHWVQLPPDSTNTRGLQPNQIWQVDVTHILSFEKLKFIHVTIDTCSGFIFTSLATKKKKK